MGDAASVVTHEAADFFISTDRAGAGARDDAAPIQTHEAADTPVSTDRAGAGAPGDAASIVADEAADISSADRARAGAVRDAALAVVAHEGAGNRAGHVDIHDRQIFNHGPFLQLAKQPKMRTAINHKMFNDLIVPIKDAAKYRNDRLFENPSVRQIGVHIDVRTQNKPLIPEDTRFTQQDQLVGRVDPIGILFRAMPFHPVNAGFRNHLSNRALPG